MNVDRMVARLDEVAATSPGDEALGVIRDFKRGLKGIWPFVHDDEKAGA